jgi:hypothetical protein
VYIRAMIRSSLTAPLLPALLLVASAATSACTLGAPPGFSSGDAWSFPLVGPMEEKSLVAPVYIDDQGPYLMLLDPDANVSIIDEAIASELQLRSGWGPRRIDETDTQRNVRLADVRTLRIGDLTVSSPQVEVSKVGAFAVDARQIRGVIGRDIFADSLTFAFDRDRGRGYVTTKQGFSPPAGATALPYRILSSHLNADVVPPGRRLLEVEISGKRARLHLDLGAPYSELRQSRWGAFGLATIPTSARLVDEIGTVREVTQAGLASNVTFGPVALPQLALLPYADRRWEDEDIDGTIGLDALRGQNVAVNWDTHTVYLTPRSTDDLLAERLGRWGSDLFTTCEHPGCVAITSNLDQIAASATSAAAAGAGAPSTASAAPSIMPAIPKAMFTVTRDATANSVDLEVLLEAVDGSGARIAGWPRYSINLPKGTSATSFELSLGGEVDAANLRWVVRDASPFPRACRGGGACAAPLP